VDHSDLLASLEFVILNTFLVDVNLFVELNVLTATHLIQALVAVVVQDLVLALVVTSCVQQRHVLLVEANVARLALLLVLAGDALVGHRWLLVVLAPPKEEFPLLKIVLEPGACRGYTRVQLPHEVDSLLHPLEVAHILLDDLHEFCVELVSVTYGLDEGQLRRHQVVEQLEVRPSVRVLVFIKAEVDGLPELDYKRFLALAVVKVRFAKSFGDAGLLSIFEETFDEFVLRQPHHICMFV